MNTDTGLGLQGEKGDEVLEIDQDQEIEEDEIVDIKIYIYFFYSILLCLLFLKFLTIKNFYFYFCYSFLIFDNKRMNLYNYIIMLKNDLYKKKSNMPKLYEYHMIHYAETAETCDKFWIYIIILLC
jgi:hypothetical protein